jgi:hypothetical protein
MLSSVISMSVVAKIRAPVSSVNFITSERITRDTALRMGAMSTPERAPVLERVFTTKYAGKKTFSPVLKDHGDTKHLNCG